MAAMKHVLLILIFLACPANAHARIVTEAVDYRHGDAVLEGYLAYDGEVDGKRPGVLIVHQWKGLGDYEKMRAGQLAKLGYVAFALDMYGKGIRPKDRKEAAEEAGKYRDDRALMRSRANAGLEVLKGHPLVDPSRVAAIGYCFGGGTVLELARSGADVAGVVSFHGNLDTPDPNDAKKIKAKVLVLHGADDPHVPPDQVTAFQEEMRSASVDWQLIAYGGAVHSFTSAGAGNDPSRGAAYNANADRRSWQAMQSFFAEIFHRE
jgi:dienelactone hydrolase